MNDEVKTGGGRVFCSLVSSFIILLLFPSASFAADAPETLRIQQRLFHEAVSRISPCVVTIETIGGTNPAAPAPRRRPPPTTRPTSRPAATQPVTTAPTTRRVRRVQRPRRRPRRRPTAPVLPDGPTTGLIYSTDGLILSSSFNFVREPQVITVRLSDGRRFVARLLGRCEVRKLAMLRIVSDRPVRDLPTPEWAAPDDVHVGEWAIAVGRGFDPARDAVSVGIVSAVGRKGNNAVQTDAKISPANYGGPLIDTSGRVLGICVPMGRQPGELAGLDWYDSGIGFAIAGPRVAWAAERLARGETLKRGLLGVHLGGSEEEGVIVSAVVKNGPADKAGVRKGDRIVTVDDTDVTGLAEATRLLRYRVIGETVKLTVLRGDRRTPIEVTCGTLPAATSRPRRPVRPRRPTTRPTTRPTRRRPTTTATSAPAPAPAPAPATPGGPELPWPIWPPGPEEPHSP